MSTDTDNKLQALRQKLQEQKLAAFLQPVHDEYMNEYPPPCFRRAEWLTGFTGSAGIAAVALDKAALFTDGRYTLQAQAEVGAPYERHNSADLTPEQWLVQQLPSGVRVGYDAKLTTQSMLARMRSALGKKNIEPAAVPNLVDAVWSARPPAPASPLFIHELKYSGEESSSKRRRVGEAIAETGAEAAVIAAPDAVCWLLNVRGRDIEHSPLALMTALIDAKGTVQLFVAPERCNEKIRAHLDDVEIREPAALEKSLAALAHKKILCDPHSAPVWFSQKLKAAGATVIDGRDPCLLPKAVKNPVELSGMKAAHVRDGAAVAKLLCWLENETARRSVTEIEVGEKLLEFRAQDALFTEASFSTIAGSGPHGAIVHYRAGDKTNRALQQGELFLLDSGGQYPDGTTDITRTVAVGAPSAEHKDRFTRVLKGHIAIARARFPQGTSGSQLDALARQYLWQAGLDYDHGTGHGVGCFLGVHEGPQRISKRGGDAALMPGMIVSNEPGYYKEGAYGIRIENLVAVKNITLPLEGEGKQWFGFETITCAPIDTRLVDASMLALEERQWLNDYHAWVQRELSPSLKPDEREWLARRCAPV